MSKPHGRVRLCLSLQVQQRGCAVFEQAQQPLSLSAVYLNRSQLAPPPAAQSKREACLCLMLTNIARPLSWLPGRRLTAHDVVHQGLDGSNSPLIHSGLRDHSEPSCAARPCCFSL